MSDARDTRTTLAADRRALLRGAGGLLAVLLAPGVTLYAMGGAEAEARAPGEAVSPKVRWGLLIDVNACPADCDACVAACRTENGWADTGHKATDPHWIRKVSVRDPASGAAREVPVMCQHCASAPCVDVCPTGASFRRADGIVLVDRHICIGCRYCIMACPYKARTLVHEPVHDQTADAPRGKGTVEGCTLCAPRIDAGRLPACVEACAAKGGAMLFGDLNDPNSAIAKAVAARAPARIRADLRLDPGVGYRGL
ncbi:sulfate reduction electron transfer complex DsrMKJOP subunit DsrO [Blastochloris tepida]|uniref:4Fe-4S ferredoxin n=1 Tax=Blastochloris tepida TaxID=2233851 RepID=A0A348G4A6_9HYPH|nr:4Fe-4S dicluster domain-containing protein [Blastochloris tepida]BBF94389.1 4Fe-4S ferredoxin [Blastochloris tepida]